MLHQLRALEEVISLTRRLRMPYLRSAALDVVPTARAQRRDPAELLRVLLSEEISGRDRATLRMRRHQTNVRLFSRPPVHRPYSTRRRPRRPARTTRRSGSRTGTRLITVDRAAITHPADVRPTPGMSGDHACSDRSERS